MKNQGTSLSSSTRAPVSQSGRIFAHHLQTNKAPYFPINTLSVIASQPAVRLDLPNYSADIRKPKPIYETSLELDNFSLDATDLLFEQIATLPDASPRQFLRNHLIMCRRFGVKFDGYGCVSSTPADSMKYDTNYDIEQDLSNYNESYKHVVVKYNSTQTFEFIGCKAFTLSTISSNPNAKSPQSILDIEHVKTHLDVYFTVEEVPVFVLRQNGCMDKVFFDAGNNIAAYLNFLFTSPDLAGQADFAQKAALRLIDEQVWDFSQSPIQFINSDISNYAELINTYTAQHTNFSVEPEYLFHFYKEGQKAFLFYGEVIASCFDQDFNAATQHFKPGAFKPVNHNYVDQVVTHVHEKVYAVMTHTYSLNEDKKWMESISVVHSERMMDILQCIQDQDLRDQFMHYLQVYNIESRFVVKRDNASDLEFHGKLAGFASNRKFPDQQEGEVKPNAPTSRWTVLSLYQTKGGSFVCHQANYSINPGEHDKLEAIVTKDKDEVIKFFGYRWLAKKLYDSANFNANEIVD